MIEIETVDARGLSCPQPVMLAQQALNKAKKGTVAVLVDSNTESQPRSQPYEVYGNLTMGLTAENLAAKYGISREEQDAFALQSQERAFAAIESGRFKDEIIPVEIPQRKGPPLIFDTDEHPRRSTLEGLAALPPVFKEGGTVTAGNASGRNDGAACTVVMSAKEAARRGLKPMVTIRGMAVAGVPPEIMGIGPVAAVPKLLEKMNLKIEDIDLFEINEAFASQSVYCQRELGIPDEKLNVNGGAIALGHPLGATGAKLTATALHELKRRGGRYAIVTMCIGGGMGAAALFERV